METTEGFYKQNEVGEWMYAPNFVYTSSYTLEKDLKDIYTYPIDGWYWYDEQPTI
jgi:hypothetical protein